MVNLRKLNRKCSKCETIITDRNKSGLCAKHNGEIEGRKHSPEAIEKNRLWHLGRRLTEEEKIKRRQKMIEKGTFLNGEKNPFYGKKHTEEAKAKNRQAKLGKNLSLIHRKNISNAHLGEKFSKKRCENISLSLKGRFKGIRRNPKNEFKKGQPAWNKGVKYKDLGIKFSDESNQRRRETIKKKIQEQGYWNSPETRKKNSLSNKGKKRTPEQCENISKALTGLFSGSKHPMWGKHHSNETKRKIGIKSRITKLTQIEQNYGIPIPSYNREACEFFKKFDEKHNTKGRYAVYGDGEYYIKELGYYPDYINFELKLIIEWDEGHHFDEHDELKARDVNRQEEIKKVFPDFKFLRINHKTKNVTKV